MSRFSAPIAEQIWDMKYRLKSAEGVALDLTVEDSWRRIARALSEVEADPKHWEKKFYEALEGFKFLPAGRITAGAGTGRSVTLFNCFVMGTVPDTMSGIFEGLKEAALTMQQGGGIGYDFSTIRPRGAEAWLPMRQVRCRLWMCGTRCVARSCRRGRAVAR
jgi:ribonucleoside-diphosphate reductase alpha chain